jgi:hypothetical protein
MNQEESSDDGLFTRIGLLKIDPTLFSCHNGTPYKLSRFRILRVPRTVDRPITKSVLTQDKIDSVDKGPRSDFESTIPVGVRTSDPAAAVVT